MLSVPVLESQSKIGVEQMDEGSVIKPARQGRGTCQGDAKVFVNLRNRQI